MSGIGITMCWRSFNFSVYCLFTLLPGVDHVRPRATNCAHKNNWPILAHWCQYCSDCDATTTPRRIKFHNSVAEKLEEAREYNPLHKSALGEASASGCLSSKRKGLDHLFAFPSRFSRYDGNLPPTEIAISHTIQYHSPVCLFPL